LETEADASGSAETASATEASAGSPAAEGALTE
jgi:hypothetical protein